jgi:S-DNA-T family DNA segregation ATPase FtsK/SpoIIIE
MRKEIYGILLFFLVAFTLISLVSYHPDDPSIHNATSGGRIHNGFGLMGAHTAGVLVGLFGAGAIWVPIGLLIASIQFWRRQSTGKLIQIGIGALLLAVTTGCLLAFWGPQIVLAGRSVSSGGVMGIPLQAVLVRYTNPGGGMVIAVLLWLVGLMLSTGFSVVRLGRRCQRMAAFMRERLSTVLVKRRERHKKAQRRQQQLKTRAKEGKRDIRIKTTPAKPVRRPPPPKQQVFDFECGGDCYRLPLLDYLEDPEARPDSINTDNLKMLSRLLEKKLEDFGVRGKVVTVSPGPVITTFEYEPAAGVKINKIVNLSDDLALALRATSIRIEAPIPGKSVVGIEVPNTDREVVRIKEIIASEAFQKARSKLTVCLGKDIVGQAVVTPLEKMPHLLIAGATGTGKSVGLNAMISSLLYKAAPDEVKLIMIDPKRIELSLYEDIPHLITPVVTDVKKATNALHWAVKEMERRYELLSSQKTRNLQQYNQKAAKARAKKEDSESAPERLPLIVIVIDELADLMMVASRDVEVALTRLAQMARAAGIHLILATQRPSVDVLTGIIKANFPTRLTFQVSSRTDSRTIIDANGAESLLGNGDMLFLPPGTSRLQRIHGAFISEDELIRITDHLKKQKQPDYLEDVTQAPDTPADAGEQEEYDERYDDAVALVTKHGQASISMVQRHLRIGYNRAARIIEVMEREGVVGPADGAKPREVLVRGYTDQ